MRIALSSFEYPPDTAIGGIATYAREAAAMLSARGHEVEVFAGSFDRSGSDSVNGYPIHRVRTLRREEFSEAICPVFLARHRQARFDVLEGADFMGESMGLAAAAPSVPFVVKLHCGMFMIRRIEASLQPLSRRAWALMRALRHRELPPGHCDHPSHAIERTQATAADEVVAPCASIAELSVKSWKLDRARLSVLPNPYAPSSQLLNVPPDTNTGVVSFVGRLELRKGVLALAEAIPLVLRQHPAARFRFVGRSQASPEPGIDMREYLRRRLKPYGESVRFEEAVPLSEMAGVYATTDLCVFPSVWENFPNVCLEAMAAGRGIIGSNCGGMVEQLDGGRVGRLVPPRSPGAIAAAIVELLRDRSLRIRLGTLARERVLSEYSPQRVAVLQEKSYHRAIERRAALGARRPAAGG